MDSSQIHTSLLHIFGLVFGTLVWLGFLNSSHIWNNQVEPKARLATFTIEMTVWLLRKCGDKRSKISLSLFKLPKHAWELNLHGHLHQSDKQPNFFKIFAHNSKNWTWKCSFLCWSNPFYKIDSVRDQESMRLD